MLRPSQSENLRLAYSVSESTGHISIAGTAKKLFSETKVPVDEWVKLKSNTRHGLNQLRGLSESGELAKDQTPLVAISEFEVLIHPDCIAQLDAGMAASLELPSSTTLALDLKSNGLITDDNFVIQTRWVRPGGSPVRTRINGAIIEYEGHKRRIPEPLYSLWNTSVELNAPSIEGQRFSALSRLQALLPEQARTAYAANGYLSETRIHYASAFSLKLGRADPFDFDPVLFDTENMDEAKEGSVLSEEDGILPPSGQKIFAEDRFRRGFDVKPAYALRDGDYVFIDPALRPVLQEIRNLQEAQQQDRRDFIFNPLHRLRQRLGDVVSDTINVDQLFIETEQFSSRVSGIDVWTKPVLPWLKQTPNSWLPEKFGLRIGDNYIEVPPAAVAPLTEAVQVSISTQVPTAKFDEIEVPANQQTLNALDELKLFVQADSDQITNSENSLEGVKQKVGEKLFLIVRENFEEVDFCPYFKSTTHEKIILETPKLLKSSLKPHQVDGLKWLVEAHTRQMPGGLLADDMGLGKTLQAIAFIAWLHEQSARGKRPKGTMLVVAPTGLLANWRNEIETHLLAPYLGEIVLAFGSNLKALREEDNFGERDIATGKAGLQTDAWKSAGVVLTTYETMRDYHISFARWPFDLIIYDEIQKLKNPDSQLRRAAATLNAKFVLGMTGTPVENRLQDLWSIMDIISPSTLGSSKEFERKYQGGDAISLTTLRSLLCDRVNDLPPLMLRRMKSDHLPEMPEKKIHAKEVLMPELQANAYANIVRRAIAGRSGLSKRDGILQILHAMRGISLHPIDPDDAPVDLEEYAAQSARLSWTLEILKEVQSKNEKALIFVESLSMQAKLASLIQSRFMLKHTPSRIHGGVPGVKRQEIVSRFQSQPTSFDVMLLSPKAGGVGLTITAANHVIHLSRWWNPAVEDQSTDRVYRIGQKKTVHVYLPLAVHSDPTIGPSSFDIRLNNLLERKRALSRDMLVPPEGSDQDISDLFNEVSLYEKALDEQIPLSPTPSDNAPKQSSENDNESALEQKRPDEVFQPDQRKVLSLARIPDRAEIRFWRIRPLQERPIDEILEIFESAVVSSVEIKDPYAIANADARSAQAAFVQALLSRTKSVDMVHIEYRRPENEELESEAMQRRDMGARWAKTLGEAAQNTHIQLSSWKKIPGQDFHDRFVYVSCKKRDGSTMRHTLQLGRGLLGLMHDKYECNITYIPPD